MLSVSPLEKWVLKKIQYDYFYTTRYKQKYCHTCLLISKLIAFKKCMEYARFSIGDQNFQLQDHEYFFVHKI